jgi:hypothetical protein
MGGQQVLERPAGAKLLENMLDGHAGARYDQDDSDSTCTPGRMTTCGVRSLCGGGPVTRSASSPILRPGCAHNSADSLWRSPSLLWRARHLPGRPPRPPPSQSPPSPGSARFLRRRAQGV